MGPFHFASLGFPRLCVRQYSHVPDTKGLCAAVTRDAINVPKTGAIGSVVFPQVTVGKNSLAAAVLPVINARMHSAALRRWSQPGSLGKVHVQPLKEYYIGRRSTNTIWRRHRHISVNTGIKRPISCYRWVDLRKSLSLPASPGFRRIFKKPFRASRVC